MFKRLVSSEENLYHLSFDVDLQVLQLYSQENLLNLSNDLTVLELNSLIVQFTEHGLSVKIIKSPLVDDIVLVDNLVEYLINVKNPVEFLLTKDQLNNYQFFHVLSEKYLKLNILHPYLNNLKNLGLDFDTSVSDKNQEGDFLAIDCVDYIKFIPFDQYSKEKQVKQLVAELCSQTNKEPIQDWLETIYRRYLYNNSFDSNGIHHILDWMNQLTDFSVLKQSLSYDRALAKADQWVEKENQKLGIVSSRDINGVDIQILYNYSGYELSHLLSADAKKREGQKMHNCIGSVHLKNPDLYSIRYNGRRVASICFREQKIVEVKGPWNKEVENIHRPGVRNCLENGLKVIYEGSKDLTNIGVKQFSLNIDGIMQNTLIAKEGDALFDYPTTNIKLDNIFQGSTQEQIPILKQTLLTKFPDSLQSEIKEKLILMEKQFIPCPVTGFLFHETHNYARFKIPKIKQIVDQYPQFLETLKKITLNCKDANIKNGPYQISNLATAINLLAQQPSLLSGSELEKRAFLHSFSQVDESIELIPGLYQNILGKSENIDELYGKVADYTFLKAIYREQDNLNKFLKASDPSFDFDSYELESPYECDACDNYKVFQEQMSVVEEFNELGNEASELVSQMSDALDQLKDLVEQSLRTYKSFSRYILLNPRFKIATAQVVSGSYSEAKELYNDLNDWVEEFSNIVKEYPMDKVNDLVNILDHGHNRLNEIERSMGRVSDGLSRLSGDSCDQCKSCLGSGENEEGETCSDCKGQPEDCGGEKIVDDNMKNHLSVRYDFNLFNSWSKQHLDLTSIEYLVKSLSNIEDEPKEFLRGVFVFFNEHTNQ